jgi:GNAT superfamily N-acetyltransferase
VSSAPPDDLAQLTFRRARREDAAVIVPLMHASSPALIESSFRVGRADPDAFLQHDFLRGEGLFGYRNQWVLSTPDGTPVATVTAYPGADYGRLLRATLVSALQHFSALDLLRVLWRASVIGRLFATPRRDGVFVANACVPASLRSRGLFSRLMTLAIREVGQGRRVAELDVSLDNPRAQALYERLGWVVASERSRGEGAQRMGFRRMMLALRR